MINEKQLETIAWELDYNLSELHKAALSEAKLKAKAKIPRLMELKLNAYNAIKSLLGEANALNDTIKSSYR